MSVTINASVRCENVWKIYGTNARLALKAALGGLGRALIQERFDCVVAVSDVTLSVSPGEVFCVMGLSGSGKSTLLRHINRLVEPTAGRVLIDDVNVNEISDAELRRLRATKIGMVFQNVALFPHRTVLDNVVYGLEVRNVDRNIRRCRAREKLDLVGLLDWADRYPDELSGGMQQRVGLARALAADPEILLMDEPFSALDPLIRRQLQDEFVNLSGVMKKTTIFVTHDLNEATRVGDRIAIMRDGGFVQVGTPEEIVANPADDYVAEFVRDISPLTVVRARSLMVPIAEAPPRSMRAEATASPRVSCDATLEMLIDIAVGTDQLIVVTDDAGREIGIVTRELLLSRMGGRSSQRRGGGKEASAESAMRLAGGWKS